MVKEIKSIVNSDKRVTLYFLIILSSYILLPILIAYAMGALLSAESIDSFLIKIAIILIVIVLIRYVETIAKNRVEAFSSEYRVDKLHRLNKQYLSVDYDLLENEDAISKMNTAFLCVYSSDKAFGIITKNLIDLLTQIVAISLIFYYFLILDKMFLFVIVTKIMLLIIISKYKRRNWDKNFVKESEVQRRLKYITDTMNVSNNGKDIRLFGMRDLFESKHQSAIKEFATIRADRRKYLILEVGIELVFSIALYILFIRVLLNDSGLSVTAAIVLFSILNLVNMSSSRFVTTTYEVRKNLSDIAKYNEYINIQDIDNVVGDTNIYTNKPTISFKNVSYSYDGKRNVINNLSFDIEAGSNLAIVGDNGAGKTTIIKLMMGLYKPTSGEILLNGRNIKELNINAYHKLFSVIFQEQHQFYETFRESVIEGEEWDEIKFNSVLDKARLNDLVAKLPKGIDTILVSGIDSDGVSLSGGELQRLKFARAIYKDAPIFVLDEPTSALDPFVEQELFSMYGDIMKEKTSIYISHRLSSTKFCDEIIVLRGGEVVDRGTHDELVSREGYYKQVFNIQKEAYYA